MRITCKYSGVSFLTAGFDEIHHYGQHPIFELNWRQLNSMATSWSKYDEPQQRLLFTALLKTTGVVDFRHPAIPSIQIIARWNELLHQTVRWQQTINFSVQLPGFRVTRDNYTIKTIGGTLLRWAGIRNEWENKTHNEQLSEVIRRKEEFIIGRIKRGYSDLGRLIKLAMLVSNTPTAVQGHWISLFSLKPDKLEDKQKIWNAPLSDLKDMYSHFLKTLDSSTIWGSMILEHCRSLIKMNSDGMQYSIMDYPVEEQEELGVRLKTFSDSPYTIITSKKDNSVVHWTGGAAKHIYDKEQKKWITQIPSLAEIIGNIDAGGDEEDYSDLIISMNEELKPKASDFPTKVAFLKAEIAWDKEVYRIKMHNEQIQARKQQAKEQDTSYALGAEDEEVSSEELRGIIPPASSKMEG